MKNLYLLITYILLLASIKAIYNASYAKEGIENFITTPVHAACNTGEKSNEKFDNLRRLNKEIPLFMGDDVNIETDYYYFTSNIYLYVNPIEKTYTLNSVAVTKYKEEEKTISTNCILRFGTYSHDNLENTFLLLKELLNNNKQAFITNKEEKEN